MMRYQLGSCLLLSALIAACGTVPTKMENLSPEPVIPVVSGFSVIDAVVWVRSEAPGDLFPNDVAQALTAESVFRSVLAAEAGVGKKVDLEIIVKSTPKSDLHFSAGMGKAVLSGLTLGLASSSQIDPYDYEVAVETEIVKSGKRISSYQVIGRFHSEVAASAPIAVKTGRVQTAVANSYGHALALLVAKIKQDRSMISAAAARK